MHKIERFSVGKIYRRKRTVYLINGKTRTADGKRVVKDMPGAEKIITYDNEFSGKLKLGKGKHEELRLFASETASREKLAELQRKVARDFHYQGSATLDASSDLFLNIEKYKKFMTGKGNQEKHTERQITNIKEAVHWCEFKIVADINQQKFNEYVDYLKTTFAHKKIPERKSLDFAREWYTIKEITNVMGEKKPIRISAVAKRENLETKGYGRYMLYHRSAVEWLQSNYKNGLSEATVNSHISAFMTFVRYLFKEKRTPPETIVLKDFLF